MTKSFNFQLIHKILYTQNEKKNRKFFYSWKFLRLKLNKKNKDKYEESKRPKPFKILRVENKEQLKLVNDP